MLRYFWPSDDEQLAGQQISAKLSEDADWWVGVQRAGATLALAGALALTAVSTTIAASVFSQSQDDPAGSLVVIPTPPDEAYWANPVPPLWYNNFLPFADNDTQSQYVNNSTQDEDFWVSGVAPISQSFFIQLPLVEHDDFPQFPAQVNPLDDGGLWAPQIPPADLDWNVLFFLDDGSWVPALQPDEDFWAPQIAPVVWPMPAQPFRADDGEQFVQRFQADEQFWANPVAPVAASLALLQPFTFDQHDNTGGLRNTFDEDYWQNPVAPVVWPQPSVFIDDITVQTFIPPFQPDEDFWANPVAPVVWNNLVFPAVSQDEVTTPVLPTNAPPDEVFWIPMPPMQQTFAAWTNPPAQPPNEFQFDETFQSFVPPPFVPPVVVPGSLLGLFGYNRNI